MIELELYQFFIIGRIAVVLQIAVADFYVAVWTSNIVHRVFIFDLQFDVRYKSTPMEHMSSIQRVNISKFDLAETDLALGQLLFDFLISTGLPSPSSP